MALVTQAGNLVWQKVKNALSAANANPAEQRAFIDALKPWLAQQKRNPDLQIIPFSAEQIVTAGGFPTTIGVARVHGVWFKGRRTAGVTNSFFQLFDQADNTASTTLIVLETRINSVGQSFCALFGQGLLLTTNLTIAADTTVAGDTESAAADACDGFVIVGAV